MTKQSEAEKAASSWLKEDLSECLRLCWSSGDNKLIREYVRDAFLAGAAWAAPKWKCPPEYPNEGDLIVVKRHDEGNSFTYHLSRSVRSIPVFSSWMVIEPAAPEVEK